MAHGCAGEHAADTSVWLGRGARLQGAYRQTGGACSSPSVRQADGTAVPTVLAVMPDDCRTVLFRCGCCCTCRCSLCDAAAYKYRPVLCNMFSVISGGVSEWMRVLQRCGLAMDEWGWAGIVTTTVMHAASLASTLHAWVPHCGGPAVNAATGTTARRPCAAPADAEHVIQQPRWGRAQHWHKTGTAAAHAASGRLRRHR